MNGLFRQSALEHITDPEQLDHTLRIVRPAHYLGLLVIGCVVLGGLAWSVFATAPVTVSGRGILLSPAGVSVVSAPAEGRVSRILVQPGDHVHAGQDVALLDRPASRDAMTAKRAQLDDARRLLAESEAAYAEYEHARRELLAAKRTALTEQLDRLAHRRDRLVKYRAGLADANSGNIAAQADQTAMMVADLEDEIAAVRNQRAELAVRQRAEHARKTRNLAVVKLRVQSLQRDVADSVRDFERKHRLKAPTDGTVTDFYVNAGDWVGTGQVVMRMLPGTAGQSADSLQATVFVPNEDGKKIKPGMAARIMPSTTRPQKDGFIVGKVLSVASIPSSREGIMRRLKNEAQTDALLETGAPFEVQLALTRDADTPSGYQWSSGRGPGISVDAGTIATADIVVSRSRVVSLILPFFDYLFRWLGVR